MGWSLLIRVGCMAAVMGMALVWRPSGLGPAADAFLGLAVALLALWGGHRMQAVPLSHIGGALLGGALTLPVAQSLQICYFFQDVPGWSHRRLAAARARTRRPVDTC